MIYFDNASTSFPKPKYVWTEMEKCMKEYCANSGRSGHAMSIRASKAALGTRELLASMFNIDSPIRICFTKNATEALNYAVKGVLKKGDHVITTSMEHNSVIRPLMTMEKQNIIEVSIIRGNEFGEIDAEDVKKYIKGNTKMIACTLSSNVNGTILPIVKIGEIARKRKLIFLVDASQGAGCIDIDVKKSNIDMLAFPGHKCLMGPTGTGGLYVSECIDINSVLQGGTGTESENMFQPKDMPELLESGTINIVGIAGLGASLKFIKAVGTERIRKHKFEITSKIISEIKQIDRIKVHSLNDFDKNCGIVAFNLDKINCNQLAYMLDKDYEIAVRAGLHCAPLAHKTLNTLENGILRVSPGYFNTDNDVEILVNAVKTIAY
jgi:cysteine desulfurase family protein